MADTKLELTWIGKDKQPKLEPRILIEDPDKSYGDRNTENMLIFGDNLLALKALEQHYVARIKCIYIDPPYNTGSAFEYYDDGLEHSLWLSLMRNRLEILGSLLTYDGSIWISIDDNEYPYLRVVCDEVFGRSNFICTVIWEKRKSRENRRVFSFKHDYVVVYSKSKASFEKIRNPIPINDEVLQRYKNLDNDLRGSWQSVAITAQAGHGTASQFYSITTPSGRKIDPPPGNCWRFTENRLSDLIQDNRIYFGATGNNVPRQKKFLSESEDAGMTPETIWYADDVGTNDTAKRHSNTLFDGNGFDNPKPEELLKRIIEIATNPGDLVLDSFSGSGTTGAVAHKMGRKWIMVELGDHCNTHIQPRLQKVCDGTDQGGISGNVNWKGGGGFKYYYMAPSLLKKDRYDQWVINEGYNPTMLAAAMAKHESFRYCPDEVYYWKQGQSSEKDFIFTTTAHLTPEHLDRIHEEMQPDDGLLICCKSHFEGADSKYSNITVKKIPSMLLGKCEFDRDDYSLNIVDMPCNPDDPAFVPSGPAVVETKKEEKKIDNGQMRMF
jgi:adenine-specific DNA-methyltransferase